MNNDKTTVELNGNAWVNKSARLPHGVAAYGLRAGLDAEGQARLVKAVLAFIRRDIADNGCTVIETETKGGKPKTITAKEFDATQKVSGSAEGTKLTWGKRTQILIGECSLFTRRVTRQDDAFAALEKEGAGVEWVPVPGSVETRKLDELCVAIAAQLREQREGAARKAQEDAASKAAREAAELAALG